MYICAECKKSIPREEIDWYNGQPYHGHCKISAMMSYGCSREDIENELRHIGYSDDMIDMLMLDLNF